MIELLIVVLLLAVIAGIAIPNFGQTYKNTIFRKTAEDLLYTMRYAQSRAITKQRVHQLQFDAARTQYWIMQRTESSDDDNPSFEHVNSRRGRTMTVPSGIQLDCDHQAINFYPDGTIEKTRIFLTAGERVMTVSSMELKGQINLLDFKP